jgi:hypothetical protein
MVARNLISRVSVVSRRATSTRVIAVLAVALVMVVLPARVFAQNAELRGVVADLSGGVLPGVTVTLTNVETGVARALVTDDAGAFRAPGLRPGPYRIEAELAGFGPEARELRLTVGQVADVRLALRIGTVAETVMVSGSAALIETTKSDLSEVVTAEQLSDLPVLNRGFIGLAQLLPGGGPARSADARFGMQTSFGGTNFRSMYSVRIDGGAMDNPVLGIALVNVNQDAVQEFRVLRNQFDAEYSGAGTAIVNVLTRSGTNDFRGSFSYYGRDEKLNAKNAFATTKLPFDLLRVSGSAGGPIMRDRAHFFGAVEYLDSTSVRIIALPATNPFAQIYNGEYGTSNLQKTGQAKVDYVFNSTHSAWVRHLYDNLDIGEEYSQGQLNFNKMNNVAGQWSWTVSPSKFNTLFVQYVDQTHGRTHNSAEAQVQRPSFTSGRSPNLPQLFPRKRWTVNETLFWTRGDHALKVGAQNSYEILNFDGEYFGLGVWTFNTDRPFDANDQTTWPVRYTTGSGRTITQHRFWELGYYIQDDWKIRDRLTLNLGLRYDLDTNLRSNKLMERLVADPQYAGLDQLFDSPRGNDYDQVQPRLSFAWDTRGDGRTVVRGGYGIYSVRNRPWFNVLGESITTQFTAEVNDPALLRNYPDRTATLGGRSLQDFVRSTGGRAIYLPGDNLDLPRVHNWTLGFAKVLFKETSIEIDAIHSVQKDLQTGTDINLPARGPLSSNPRPFSQFSSVTSYDGKRTSWYDSLQTMFKSRYRSATFQVAYTLAKAISDGTDDNASTSTDPFNTFGNDDLGLDENDRRHALTWSSIVQLPYGVQVSGIVSLRTGTPWNITAGVDLDGDGNAQDRPAGLVKNAGGIRSEGNLAIINAFRTSRRLAPITMDQLGLGASERIVDVRFTKQFQLPKASRLDVFLEGYNLFNTVNYATPSGTITSGSFAVRTTAGDPRQIQWGGRIAF